ncbi:MAG: LysR family transcriptional regulator [Burkholderiaceae bacterium]|nr:LysR family transcriptional regulator [Burkholderiaceae bacterium]
MAKSRLTATDLNLFKVFAAIYQQRNLTRAGEQLATTQPAVTKALARLEHVFREKLFLRISGEMRPTNAAERVAPFVFDAINSLEKAISGVLSFDPNSVASHFKVGGNDYVSMVVLPRLLEEMAGLEVPIDLTLIHCTHVNAAALLCGGAVDCALVTSPVIDARLVMEPLFEDDYVVICSKSHFGDLAEMTIEKYLSVPHVLVSHVGQRDGWVDCELAKSGLSRRVLAIVPFFSGVLPMVTTGLVFCTIPRRLARLYSDDYKLCTYEVPLTTPFTSFFLLWPRLLDSSPAAAWFREKIRQQCAAL